MRERGRESPERTTAAAMARKQETIKANCRRRDGVGTDDRGWMLPHSSAERAKCQTWNTFLEGDKKERALKINPFSQSEMRKNAVFAFFTLRLNLVVRRLTDCGAGHIDPTATSKGMPNENMQRSTRVGQSPIMLPFSLDTTFLGHFAHGAKLARRN